MLAGNCQADPAASPHLKVDLEAILCQGLFNFWQLQVVDPGEDDLAVFV